AEDGIRDWSVTGVQTCALPISLGGSPRAAIALLQTGKTIAALQGRDYVVPDDIKLLVPPVMRHRVILKPEAEIEGLNADRALERDRKSTRLKLQSLTNLVCRLL